MKILKLYKANSLNIVCVQATKWSKCKTTQGGINFLHVQNKRQLHVEWHNNNGSTVLTALVLDLWKQVSNPSIKVYQNIYWINFKY